MGSINEFESNTPYNNTLYLSPRNQLYVGANNGLFIYKNSKWTKMPCPENQVNSILENNSGHMIVAGSTGVYYRYPNKWRKISKSWIIDAVDLSDSLWMEDQYGVVRIYNNENKRIAPYVSTKFPYFYSGSIWSEYSNKNGNGNFNYKYICLIGSHAGAVINAPEYESLNSIDYYTNVGFISSFVDNSNLYIYSSNFHIKQKLLAKPLRTQGDSSVSYEIAYISPNNIYVSSSNETGNKKITSSQLE